MDYETLLEYLEAAHKDKKLVFKIFNCGKNKLGVLIDGWIIVTLYNATAFAAANAIGYTKYENMTAIVESDIRIDISHYAAIDQVVIFQIAPMNLIAAISLIIQITTPQDRWQLAAYLPKIYKPRRSLFFNIYYKNRLTFADLEQFVIFLNAIKSIFDLSRLQLREQIIREKNGDFAVQNVFNKHITIYKDLDVMIRDLFFKYPIAVKK